MQRVAQNRSATISQTFYVDGAATNPSPDSATVTITRANGTVLYTDASASDAGTGVFTYTLTPADTALLDTLRLDWKMSYGGQTQTITDYVEVAGGFLFTIAEARALKPLDNTTTYPTATLVAMRTTVEQALEDACGVAFVPRYERETITGNGATGLMLKWPKLRAIRSASATYLGSTTTLSAGDLANLTFDQYGSVNGYRWTNGYPWTIGYEHGWDRPPERIRRAALTLAKTWLVSSPVDDRAATFSSAEGGTYGLVVEGRAGSTFGIPTVDAAVQQYSLAVSVA